MATVQRGHSHCHTRADLEAINLDSELQDILGSQLFDPEVWGGSEENPLILDFKSSISSRVLINLYITKRYQVAQ